MEDILTHASSEYKFKLNDFDGPLDLLLELIRQKNIDILDVQISQITDQYFEYMEQIDELDMDVASDFLTIAATLLEIKSKNILPKELDLEDEEDIESTLKRRLLEYKLFKDQSEKLKERETLNRLYREPQYNENDVRLSFHSFDMDKMLDAFAVMLSRFAPEKAHEVTKKVEREKYTVQEKIANISMELMNRKKIDFLSLFTKDTSKSEILSTFLALLELMKIQVAIATQPIDCPTITIELKKDFTVEEIQQLTMRKSEFEDDFVEDNQTNLQDEIYEEEI